MIREIYTQMKQITQEIFHAFETKRKLFLPMPNCFEIFGLDFIVDQNCNVRGVLSSSLIISNGTTLSEALCLSIFKHQLSNNTGTYFGS